MLRAADVPNLHTAFSQAVGAEDNNTAQIVRLIMRIVVLIKMLYGVIFFIDRKAFALVHSVVLFRLLIGFDLRYGWKFICDFWRQHKYWHIGKVMLQA